MWKEAFRSRSPAAGPRCMYDHVAVLHFISKTRKRNCSFAVFRSSFVRVSPLLLQMTTQLDPCKCFTLSLFDVKTKIFTPFTSSLWCTWIWTWWLLHVKLVSAHWLKRGQFYHILKETIGGNLNLSVQVWPIANLISNCTFWVDWHLSFDLYQRKTNSTNNHKDKNLRQRNTNWAARALSESSIINLFCFCARGCELQRVQTYVDLTEHSKPFPLQVPSWLWQPHEGKEEGDPYQLLMGFISHKTCGCGGI